MAEGLRDHGDIRGVYTQLHNASSVDLLWGTSERKRTRKNQVSTSFYPVERLVSKRMKKNSTEYLVKWKNYSAFENSWEHEENLTEDLIRSYDQPNIQPERLQKNLDTLHVGILLKLKSRSKKNITIDFDHDCFRYIFNGKGKQSKDGKYLLLDKADFDRCKFDGNWDTVGDKIGDGVRVKYPIKVRTVLTKSPRNFTVVSGKRSGKSSNVAGKTVI
ncbi:uncharacterized protein LOC114535332 [Dendronephthya gigantea]|uniref:uncharacterized protein LOC114535332 n=1 Tax=Dendronephthya gigantea TaxID=151771 RepID=UPI00106A2177|nr:uncharacterized protein LOC114535332 [Dendronephthya gigantea]